MRYKLPIYVVDEVGLVVKEVDKSIFKEIGKHVNYMYGHTREIVKNLKLLTDSITMQAEKFPLVILFTDITIERSVPGFYGSANLRLLVCNITDPTYSSEQRTELNFKPVITPIKEELMYRMSVHSRFTFANFSFKETDMYFYGSAENNKNVFDDHVDATEIRDLSVNIKHKIC